MKVPTDPDHGLKLTPVTEIRKWLTGGRQLKVQVVGSENSGKTTFLYTFLYHGKPFQEPSALLSYNTETIEFPRGWEFTIYDVFPGCSRFVLRNGPYYFISPETLVWYIHDCTEGTYLLPECLTTMKDKGSRYIWCILSKQDLLPPAERDSIVAEHRAKIEAIFKKMADPEGIRWFIVADPGWNLKQGDFVRPFVKGVTQDILEMDKEKRPEYNRAGDGAPSITSDEDLRARAERAEIKDADAFWNAFTTADMTGWNHLDHLQAGYLVMLQSIDEKHGMLSCASTFLEHLSRLREAHPDMFRNTAHFTMTAFWLIQLRIATFTFQYDANDGSMPTKNDFRSVVVHTPSLLNTQLWRLYYSKDVLFAPEARSTFVIPDVNPFPQVTKPLLKSLAEGADDIPADGVNIDAQETPDTLFVGPHRLLRWAFEVVQNVLSNNLRRGAAVKDALAHLQVDTLKLRAKYPKLAETGDVPPYSETQAYFWIQYVHILLSALDNKSEKEGRSLPSDIDVHGLSFEKFLVSSPTESSAWAMYYSQGLWESVEARMEFVNPDRKPLPNIMQVV